MNAKKLCAILALLGLVFLGTGASAEFGTIDAVPAATLLLPYFEVDLDDDTGMNTLFSINNASAAATVAHVVIWSDVTIPVLDFNVYLTGYDMQTINLRNIIVNGVLPQTADDDSDPPSTPGDLTEISPSGLPGIPAPLVSNDGVDPVWEGSFGSAGPPDTRCGAGLPNVPPILLDRLQEGLTGQETDFDDDCLGFDHGDRIARGYITVDNVVECTLAFPGDAGYFGDGGSVSDENQLWGDFFIIDQNNDYAFGETLVHIEADASQSFDGDQSFYGRFLTPQFTGEDNREALGNWFATRYLTGSGFTGGTDLIVWREAGPWDNFDLLPFPCGDEPDWYPLNETLVVAFDEREQWTQICVDDPDETPISPQVPGDPDPTCFPLEAQRVTIGDAQDNLHQGALTSPYANGWMFLDLQAGSNTQETQAWVLANMSALGRYSVGYDVIQLNNLTFEPAFSSIAMAQ